MRASELLENQSRVSAKWRAECEKTSAAYERVVEQMSHDLKLSVAENEHWRQEVHKAAVLKQQRRSTARASLESSVSASGAAADAATAK